jgi:hypothetical protein
MLPPLQLQDNGVPVYVQIRDQMLQAIGAVAEKPPPVDMTRQAKRVASLAQQAIAISNSAGVDPIDVAQEILRTAKRPRSTK